MFFNIYIENWKKEKKSNGLKTNQKWRNQWDVEKEDHEKNETYSYTVKQRKKIKQKTSLR